MYAMVKVVHPLGVKAVAALPGRVDQLDIIFIGFGDDHDFAAQRLRELRGGFADLAQDMFRAFIPDGVNGVEP